MPRTWFLPGLLLLLGCNSDPHNVGKTFPVQGRVTLNGKPLPTGTVIFHPDAAKGNTIPHEGRSLIDADGGYRLQTADRDGVPPGWYRVAVMASKPTTGHSHAPPQWLVPLKYLDHRKSGLTCEVVADPAEGAYDLKLMSSD